MNTTTMPALFVGHGSPMNALEVNPHTMAWRELGASLPRPRAILMVSAHWYINATAITAAEKPRVIHDFYGFAQALFDFDYPALGSPDLAHEVAELVKPTWVGLDHDSWGLDHGAWSVLAHLFPAADVPVVQLSVDASKPLGYHVALGAQLAALRESGVLIVGSGNVVHNLGRLDFTKANQGFDWAQRFDEAARKIMTSAPEDFVQLGEHRDFANSAPTPDHFLPLAYIAGLAASGDAVTVFNDDYALGSLSMTSYVLSARPS